MFASTSNSLFLGLRSASRRTMSTAAPFARGMTPLRAGRAASTSSFPIPKLTSTLIPISTPTSRLQNRTSLSLISSPTKAFAAAGTRGFSSSTAQMDKLKSHSGTKKRFFRTGGGLFKRGQAGKRHLNTLFSPGRINRLGRTAYASVTQSKMLRKLLPYA